MKNSQPNSLWQIILLVLLSVALIGEIIFLVVKKPTPVAEIIPSLLPEIAQTVTPPAKKGQLYAPVLLYHHLAKKDPQDSYYVSPEIFDEQLKWLKDNDFESISFKDLYDGLYNDKKLPNKPVVISFDDGNADNFTLALPILKKYDFKAIFFVRLDWIGKGDKMNLQNLKQLLADGMEIGSHTMTHQLLTSVDDAALASELSDSRAALEQSLKTKIEFVAYPGGNHDERVLAGAKSAGYLAGATTHHEVYHKYSSSPFEIARIHIDDEMPSFIDWVQGINLK
jgi:peptidoglycan/xylan/chitin deacetylase (PgdA/CDA1 family)